MSYSGNIVGYWNNGVCVCTDCAEDEDINGGEPIYLKEAQDEDLECDYCYGSLEDLAY